MSLINKIRKSNEVAKTKTAPVVKDYDPNSTDEIAKRIAIWSTVYGVDSNKNDDAEWAGRR